MMWALLVAVAAVQGGGAPARLDGSMMRASFAVTPETVYVGAPASLELRVIAPAGARIQFPPAVDSTSAVEPLDPVSTRTEARGSSVEHIAVYRFLAWETGEPVIGLRPVRLELGGATHDVPFDPMRVVVLSVLPADTSQRTPRDARDISVVSVRRWPWWAVGLAGFVIAAALGWWLQRGRRSPALRVPPGVRAQRAFTQLRALDLIGAGEPAKYVAASADILREFLTTRTAGVPGGLTTHQLVGALRDDSAVPLQRVRDVLETADAVKFAAQPIDAVRAERLGAEATAVVAEVQRADVHRAKKK